MAIDISVVIPTYKEELYIANCLNAMRFQSAWDSMEIIIADYDPDGKQTTIKAISEGCAEWVRKKTRLVKVPKNGIGYARGIGISAAKGKYIVNFDSDSYFSNRTDIRTMVDGLFKQNLNPVTNQMVDVKVAHCAVMIQPSDMQNVEAYKFNFLYNLRNTLLASSRLPACYEQGLTLRKKTYIEAGGFMDVREYEGPILCTTIAALYSASSLKFEPSVSVLTSGRRGMGSNGIFFDANYSHAYR